MINESCKTNRGEETRPKEARWSKVCIEEMQMQLSLFEFS